jgi:Tol biopolymer transport system component
LRRLVLIGADGRRSPLSDETHEFFEPRFSPDGRAVAVFQGLGGPRGDIWEYPLDTGIGRPVTVTGGAGWPRWQLPDGDRITHSNLIDAGVSSTSILDPSDTLLLYESSATAIPAGWTPDGETLLLEVLDEFGDSDILALAGGDTEPVLETPFLEGFADLSPDGRWLAYTSNETGQLRIWVKPYPGRDRGVPVSRQGGMDPRWSSDGSRIFYWEGNGASVPLDFVVDQLVVVDIDFDPEPQPIDTTAVLSANVPSYAGVYVSHYDVSPVDDRIVVAEETERAGITRLAVVLDWFEELKRLMPTER